MNVNDVICVGAEPIALLDYLAVERADPTVLSQIGQGLKVGAERGRGRDPRGRAGRLAGSHPRPPSPHGFDLFGFCVGFVALDAIVTGAAIEPGDALIGVPSSGIHSNGFTLARRAHAG